MADLPRVALVSRELYPFGGGGIGEYVGACARLLAQECEVTIFTSDEHEERYRELRAAGDPRIPPGDVEIRFVTAKAPEVGGFYSLLHLYSARVLEALREHYGSRGPDLVEFSDYLGEGAVTAQARRCADPFMASTVVAIRLHSSAEICSLLDGDVDDEFASRITCELERLAIRDADYLFWPGGDTLDFYHRFYGARNVAPGRRILNPAMNLDDEARQEGPVDLETPLRLLYLGRLERRKGVHNLVRAVNQIDSDQLELSLLGGDTDTAPLGGSMRRSLELAAAGDPRIRFVEPVPRTDLPRLIRASDAVTLPSLWEAWPYVGLEALRLNRPLIATPVGGFTGMVEEGASGWLAADTGKQALIDLIERLLYSRDEVAALRERAGPRRMFAALTDPTAILEAYRDVLAEGGRWTHPAARRKELADPSLGSPGAAVRRHEPPLVSVVVTYYRLPDFIEEAVASALAQTHPRVEVIVVNDGSFQDRDWVLGELATRYPITVLAQLNSGLGAARNFGISQARGRYILPLDADNVLEPDFVERALAAMDLAPTPAYVTSWSRYIDDRGRPLTDPELGYQPIGNAGVEVLRNNTAGDAIALIRRWLFDAGFAYSEELTSYEDWQLYQQLHESGHYGIVIPDRLVRYRVRSDSMIREIGFPRLARLAREMNAQRREKEVRWTSTSA